MTRSRAALRLAQAAFWAAAIAVFILAVVPAPRAPRLFEWDKAEHFLAFYVLALFAAAAFPRRPLIVLALCLSVFGGVIELVQALPLVGRDSDVWDWVTDTVAAGAALIPLVVLKWRAWLDVNH
jgi:VanZ family protein